MNRTESAQILTILAANYPHFYKNLTPNETQAVINTWAEMFEDVPAVIVLEAVKNCISLLKFPPTIADVNDQMSGMYLTAISSANDMTLSQEERSEADKLANLLYHLGFCTRSKSTPRRNACKHLLKLGGIAGKLVE